MKLTSILGLTLATLSGLVSARPRADVATPWTDPATGITFQLYTGSKKNRFGFAYPATGNNDMIGYLSAPSGYTWSGGVLGPQMNGTVLLVAWPNGQELVGSVRKVTSTLLAHAPPSVLSDNITLRKIAKGSFVSANGDWQYTFLCQGCVGRKDVNPATGPRDTFAWALSSLPILNSGDKDTLTLPPHLSGQGAFGADVQASRSDKFASWAAMAS